MGQGKRNNQESFSETMVVIGIIGIAVMLVGFILYNIIKFGIS